MLIKSINRNEDENTDREITQIRHTVRLIVRKVLYRKVYVHLKRLLIAK
jgi:hypothetical protein